MMNTTNFRFDTKGQEVYGYYLGSDVKYKKLSKLLPPTKITMHRFKGPEAEFIIFGNYDLDKMLSHAPIGHMTFIKYDGKTTLSSGKSFRKFIVHYDDAEFIDVPKPIKKTRAPRKKKSLYKRMLSKLTSMFKRR